MRYAILPEWWDNDCLSDRRLVADIEIRVSRFLGCSLADVRDPKTELEPTRYPAVQLRRGRIAERDQIAHTIHAGVRIADAVARNLRDDVPPQKPLPGTGLAWREQIMGGQTVPSLESMARQLWESGIPVVPLKTLPSPTFQGMACIRDGRPVILIGQQHDEPARVGLIVAHEAGHIAAGDCKDDGPVVELDERIDQDEIEQRANRYAADVLIGNAELAQEFATRGALDFRELARLAAAEERKSGADASFFIYYWARATANYATARLAAEALYKCRGARRTLRQFFERYVDFDAAAETDQSLLQCVHRSDDATR